MHRFGIVLAVATALFVAGLPSAASAHGRHGHHGHYGHGHHHGYGHPHGGHFYFWAAPWWAYPAYETTVVIEREDPPVYVERDDDEWWYFCESADAYYPRVETCAEPWVQVAPRPE